MRLIPTNDTIPIVQIHDPGPQTLRSGTQVRAVDHQWNRNPPRHDHHPWTLGPSLPQSYLLPKNSLGTQNTMHGHSWLLSLIFWPRTTRMMLEICTWVALHIKRNFRCSKFIFVGLTTYIGLKNHTLAYSIYNLWQKKKKKKKYNITSSLRLPQFKIRVPHMFVHWLFFWFLNCFIIWYPLIWQACTEYLRPLHPECGPCIFQSDTISNSEQSTFFMHMRADEGWSGRRAGWG